MTAILASGVGSYFADAVQTGPLLVGLFAAALAGLVSFASPCVIPLVPGYISYLAGVVGAQVEFDENGPRVSRGRWRAAGAASLFILGFTIVFLLATVTAFGAISALTLNAESLMRAGGIITIFMGLIFMGAVPFLQEDRRFQPKRISTWLGALMLGGIFALGWTPCLGPTLAAIISISAGTEGVTALRGVLLIISYCMGLGLPFLFVAFGSAKAMVGVGFLNRHSRIIQVIGGMLLICVGIALLTGLWSEFINWIRQWTVQYGATFI
ncbi:cytochrome c biogenesis CcdA family protein [Corynebacterium kutscheri]|uniref:Cytochrome c biogenesis protein n=1 Tax=Corynebacterium kutscheri TaxID=35755 RepID=A0A0F6R0K9_9CORY|nr:cytochrome c biogenesis CcdA family protein [Corynebacterium kutscheri]AKE40493.1 cytochrome c biogenesis protein [Corynebacterium kutscheri]VEH05093.1 cytochrome c-type biogenesis protein [Corynebacterium kutscheri]VEH10888.1 cytochrome c-type biogenesis protein [Corynebacterium kutscheri]